MVESLKLKLEETDKLALVNAFDQPYYYHDKIDSGILLYNIATTAYGSYDPEKCGYEPPENRKVFIDPKDIISGKNISLILQDLKNSPSKRLNIKIGQNFPWEQVQNALIDYHNVPLEHKQLSYSRVDIFSSTDNKIGMLNNVLPILDLRDNNLKLFPFHEIKSLKAQDSYFTAKNLGNNYAGCISYENSTCKNFYDLNPNSFGYDHDNSPGPYPYYYNLENFDNFLEVDVNIQEHINLETEIELLKRRIDRLERTGVQGPKGEPGERGQKGDRGFDGAPGPQGNKGDTGSSGAHGL